jgi:organic radical activating enzyme
LSAVERLESAAPGHHSVSLTGGEPLLQVEFLRELCPQLRKSGMMVYLETNGTQVEALREVLPCVDIVAMDFKLESASGVKPNTELHREFLSAAAGKEVFVKAVASASTSEAEIREAAAVIALTDRRIPMVIQPVTPVDDGMAPPTGAQLLRLQIATSRLLDNVRVIPQCHKLMGLI